MGDIDLSNFDLGTPRVANRHTSRPAMDVTGAPTEPVTVSGTPGWQWPGSAIPAPPAWMLPYLDPARREARPSNPHDAYAHLSDEAWRLLDG